ncbi:MAG: DUF3810 domain-containing protein [Bacteroidota bacterium]
MAEKTPSSLSIKLDRRLTWVGLGLLTLLVKMLFSLNPFFTEVVYSRGFFSLLRYLWDYSFGLLPFAPLYLAAPLLLGWMIWEIRKSIKGRKNQSFRHRWMGRALSFLAFLGGIIFFFHLVWGFNYQRQSLETRLQLPSVQLDSALVQIEFLRATDQLITQSRALNRAPEDSIPLSQDDLPEEMEGLIRELLTHQLKSWGYPTPGRARARRIFPAGTLMQLGALGIYIPFVGEGHVDGALPPVSQPFTLTHEMAHAYGFAEESSCNFWAYLATQASEDPVMRYAGAFSYWRYIAATYQYFFPEDFELIWEGMDKSIKADLSLLRQTLDRYPGLFPSLYKKIYDQHLKSQGIEEGLANYSRVINLVVSLRQLQEREETTPSTMP